ncbi:MAG: hypothetical protein ACKVUS_15345 [Saprospiraceae bacterium]
MTITIESVNAKELEQLLSVLKSMNLSGVQVKSHAPRREKPTIIVGDKSIDPMALFGIWKEGPRSLEEIRNAAWKRTPSFSP